MVKLLPTNAGDTGSIPGPGRCHMLSPGACALEPGTIEAHILQPVLHHKRSHHNGKPTHLN